MALSLSFSQAQESFLGFFDLAPAKYDSLQTSFEKLSESCLYSEERDLAEFVACRDNILSHKVWTVQVHSGPSDKDEILGKIELLYIPGAKLSAKLDTKNLMTFQLKPLEDRIEGFHTVADFRQKFQLTALKTEGSWVQVNLPFLKNSWINISNDPFSEKNPNWHLIPLVVGRTYDLEGQVVVITEIRNDVLLYRKVIKDEEDPAGTQNSQ